MSSLQRSEPESRPIIVVAEREDMPPEGPHWMDMAVAVYRLRWRIAAGWLVLALIQITLMPPGFARQFRWTLVVQTQTQTQTQTLEPLMGAWLKAVAGMDEARNKQQMLEVEYLKLGTGSKAEALKSGVVARATTTDQDLAPASLQSLEAESRTWIARQLDRWRESTEEAVRLARERRDLIATAQPAPVPVELAAVEMNLVQAQVNAKWPPEFTVVMSAPTAVPSGTLRDVAVRAITSLLVAVVLVLGVEGWSRVRNAARAPITP